MTKRIEFDGVIHEFPDDFTDEDIAAALDPSYTTGTAPVVQNEPKQSDDGPNFARGLTRLGDLVDMGVKGREARGKFTEGAVGELAATAVGAARGAFGADVALGAPVAAVAQNFDGQPNRSYAEIQDAIRAQNDRLMSEHPAGAGLGLVTGAVGTGGAAAKAAPQAVKNVLALAPKAPVANAARVAAMGAGAGALTEANLGGDAEQIQEAAIIGGVTAPVLSKVAKTAIQVAAPSVNRIVTMLDKKTGVSAGIKKLADKMGKVADETAVRGALAQARQQLGREPNAQELFALLPDKAQKGVVTIAETQPVVREAAQGAVTDAQSVVPQAMRQNVMGGRAAVSAPAVVAQETAAGARAAEDIRAGYQASVAESRQGVQAARRAAEETSEEARIRMAAEIRQNTQLPDDVGSPQRARERLRQDANRAMENADREPITFTATTSRNILGIPAVRNALAAMRDALPLDQRGALDTALEQIGAGQSTTLSVRTIDTLRRALRRQAQSPDGRNFPLNDTADMLERVARRESDRYDVFMRAYPEVATDIEGFEYGSGVLAAAQRAFRETIQDRGPAFASGANRGARVTIADAVTADPERAARNILERPGGIMAAMGEEGAAVVGAARRGVEEIDNAAAAARQAAVDATEFQRGLREQARAATRAVRETTQARTGAAQNAARVLTEDAGEFTRGVEAAPANMRETVEGIARTKLGEAAGESYDSAQRLARSLTTPGQTQRTSAALGAEEAQRLAQVGAAETRVAEGLKQLSRAAEEVPTGDQITGLALDMVTAIPTGRGSAGMQSNMLKRIINYGRSLGMAENTAKAVGDALFSRNPQTVQAIIQQLARSQNGRRMLAESAAIFGSMTGGQIAAEVVE